MQIKSWENLLVGEITFANRTTMSPTKKNIWHHLRLDAFFTANTAKGGTGIINKVQSIFGIFKPLDKLSIALTLAFLCYSFNAFGQLFPEMPAEKCASEITANASPEETNANGGPGCRIDNEIDDLRKVSEFHEAEFLFGVVTGFFFGLTVYHAACELIWLKKNFNKIRSGLKQ